MGERIDLPQNFNQYVKRGQEAIAKQAFKEAEKHLQMAYQIKQDDVVARLYFLALIENTKYWEAIEIADGRTNLFLNGDQLTVMYITALIESNQFIKAEAYITRFKTEDTDILDTWDFLERSLKNAQKNYVEKQEKEQKEILQKLYRIGEFQTLEQLHIMRETEKLSPKDRLAGNSAVLMNTFAHEITKTVALEDLVHLQMTEEASFLWFGNMRTIALKELEPFEKQAIVIELNDKLTKQLAQNPTLLQLIQQEMTMGLMQLYPFIDEVITSGDLWLKLYLEQYNQYTTETTNLTDTPLYKWFERLTVN